MSRDPRDSERVKFRIGQALGERCDDRVRSRIGEVLGAVLLEVEEGRPEVFGDLAERGRRKRGPGIGMMVVNVRLRGALYRRLLIVAGRSGSTVASVVRGACLWVLSDGGREDG